VLEDRSVPAVAGGLRQINLVSDVPGLARTTDPNLVNAWGIAFNPAGGPFWIADNGTGVATVYNGAGQPLPAGTPLVVTIPTPAGGSGNSAPTGEVFNNTPNFVVTSGANSGASLFIFVTEDGTISGWNPSVNATQAIRVVDNSATDAIYKGVALGNNGSGNFLYAANFHAGTIDVFNSNFAPASLSGNFTDPTLPAGFAPFNIANIGGRLYVTYAKQDAAKEDDVPGAGNGFIDVFDTNGQFIQRFASQGTLNSPWGMTVAPAVFGPFSNDLLVGNFGDGRINAFNPTTGAFVGQLTDENGNPRAIDGLWGLTFGVNATGGDANKLYFTAGPGGEAHGLFGVLQNPNQSYVAQLYRDLLHREADPGGLATWTALLDQGTLTTFQVASGIEGSPEAHNLILDQLYAKLLLRPVDPTGRIGWLDFLAGGGTTEELEANILGSPEYAIRRGGGTNAGFLTAAYQDIFSRPVDPVGVLGWGQVLSEGATHTDVAAALLRSPEANALTVTTLYNQFLHRSPDPSGQAALFNSLQAGMTNELALALIVSSEEYYNLA